MSRIAPAPFVAFTERVRERISGFEVCTCMETDAQQHPRLLAIAIDEPHALLFAAAPELLAELKRCESLLSATSDIRSWLSSDAFLRSVRAAIAKAEGR